MWWGSRRLASPVLRASSLPHPSLLAYSPSVECSSGATPHQGQRSESTTHERERCGQGQPGAATTVRELLYRDAGGGAPRGARSGACRGTTSAGGSTGRSSSSSVVLHQQDV